MLTVGDRIRIAREAANLKPADLARLTGVTRSAIAQLETGRSKNPKPAHLFAIADALRVDPRYLATGRYGQRTDSVAEAAGAYDVPAMSKEELVAQLDRALTIVDGFCEAAGSTPSSRVRAQMMAEILTAQNERRAVVAPQATKPGAASH